MRRAARLVLLVALGAAGPVPAAAQAPPSRLSRCLEGVLADAASRGARPAGDAWSGFLLEGDTASFPVAVSEDGCIGLVAVGEAKIRDIDLFLHTAGGTEVAHDVGEDAHPYVRFCGARGAQLYATVRVYAGRGEVLVSRLDAAPPTLDALDAHLGTCSAASAGVHTTRPDLGPEPPGLSLDAAAGRATAPLVALGFTPDAPVADVTFTERRGPVLVAPGCHALVVVPTPELAVEAELRDTSGRSLAEGRARETPAVLRTCLSAPAELWLRADGGGRARVVSLRPPRADGEPVGLVGGARVRYAEAVAGMAARGAHAAPLAWAAVPPGEHLSLPLPLHAGGCVTVTAIADDDVAGDDVDVVLTGSDGRLIAWDVGAAPTPTASTCPDRDELARVIVRHYGATPGEILVVVGASP